MKPYIEKNDGVPDNNRYSEALEAAKETVEALNKLTDQALAQYTALVDSAVAGHITDERELEHIMDGLLDFGDDLRFLEIYKRLCRHIFYKHPQMVGEHIYLWRIGQRGHIRVGLLQRGQRVSRFHQHQRIGRRQLRQQAGVLPLQKGLQCAGLAVRFGLLRQL